MIASSGVAITSNAISTHTITNRAGGIISGVSGDYAPLLTDLTGLALAARNNASGVTKITNEAGGSIQAEVIDNILRTGQDAPVIATYGGGQAQIINNGSIVGRIAMQAPSAPGGPGNTFVNAGTIVGSVSMGAGASNVFTMQSGSSVTGSSAEANLTVLGTPGLTFVKPGKVDGGGPNSTLVLEDPAGNSLANNVSSSTYTNFGNLTVNSGNWRLTDGPLAIPGGAVTLKGGVTTVDNNGVLGTGVIDAQGGGIASSVFRATLANDIVLGTGGLTTSDANQLVLSGKLSGTGGLTVAGTGQVTLEGANDYGGGTTVQTDATLLGNSGSLRGNIHNNGQLFFMQSGAGTYGGVLSGTGAVNKNDAATLTLTGANTSTGTFAVNGGTLAIGAGGSLSSSATVWLGPTPPST